MKRRGLSEKEQDEMMHPPPLKKKLGPISALPSTTTTTIKKSRAGNGLALPTCSKKISLNACSSFSSATTTTTTNDPLSKSFENKKKEDEEEIMSFSFSNQNTNEKNEKEKKNTEKKEKKEEKREKEDDKKKEQKVEKITKTAETSWTEKYRPLSMQDIVGNESGVSSIKEWITQKCLVVNNNNDAQKKGFPENAILLHGPPGIGKTTIAHALAREFGFDPIEFNASGQDRTPFHILQKIKQIVLTSCFIFSESSRSETFLEKESPYKKKEKEKKEKKREKEKEKKEEKKEERKGKRRCIIIDEADGMFLGPFSGHSDPSLQMSLDEFAKEISKLDPRAAPIFFICNDAFKIAALKSACKVVQLFPCFERSANFLLQRVSKQENVSFSPEMTEKLCHDSRGDLRQLLTMAQLFSQTARRKKRLLPALVVSPKNEQEEEQKEEKETLDPLFLQYQQQQQQQQKEGKGDGKKKNSYSKDVNYSIFQVAGRCLYGTSAIVSSLHSPVHIEPDYQRLSSIMQYNQPKAFSLFLPSSSLETTTISQTTAKAAKAVKAIKALAGALDDYSSIDLITSDFNDGQNSIQIEHASAMLPIISISHSLVSSNDSDNDSTNMSNKKTLAFSKYDYDQKFLSSKSLPSIDYSYQSEWKMAETGKEMKFLASFLGCSVQDVQMTLKVLFFRSTAESFSQDFFNIFPSRSESGEKEAVAVSQSTIEEWKRHFREQKQQQQQQQKSAKPNFFFFKEGKKEKHEEKKEEYTLPLYESSFRDHMQKIARSILF